VSDIGYNNGGTNVRFFMFISSSYDILEYVIICSIRRLACGTERI
jgi:hypothetical protein